MARREGGFSGPRSLVSSPLARRPLVRLANQSDSSPHLASFSSSPEVKENILQMHWKTSLKLKKNNLFPEIVYLH
jgi:hypothetical protein